MVRPRRLGAGGAVVCVLAWWWSVCRDLGDSGAGAVLVDDGFAVCPGGDEGLGGDVVDGAGQAAGGVVDQGDGVVAEQRVGSAGQFEVVGDVSAGLLGCHGGHGVAQGDPLVQGGQDAEAEHPAQGGLADEQAGQRAGRVHLRIRQDPDGLELMVRQEMGLVDGQDGDPAPLVVLGGEQGGGLGGEGGAAVGGPAAERGDDLVVDAPGAGGRIGQVNQCVPGLVERGDGGARGGCLA